MLSESKKQLSYHYLHRFQHSSCGGVTTVKVWMVYNHDLYSHNKRPDTLEISLMKVISPVVRSQGYRVNTSAVGITRKNQSMLVATGRALDLHPNGLLTHSDPT